MFTWHNPQGYDLHYFNYKGRQIANTWKFLADTLIVNIDPNMKHITQNQYICVFNKPSANLLCLILSVSYVYLSLMPTVIWL